MSGVEPAAGGRDGAALAAHLEHGRARQQSPDEQVSLGGQSLVQRRGVRGQVSWSRERAASRASVEVIVGSGTAAVPPLAAGG